MLFYDIRHPKTLLPVGPHATDAAARPYVRSHRVKKHRDRFVCFAATRHDSPILSCNGDDWKFRKLPVRCKEQSSKPIECTPRPCREPIKRRSLLSRSRDPVKGASLWLVFSQGPDGLGRRGKKTGQTLIFVVFSLPNRARQPRGCHIMMLPNDHLQ